MEVNKFMSLISRISHIRLILKRVQRYLSVKFRAVPRRQRFIILGVILLLLAPLIINSLLDQKVIRADAFLKFDEGTGTTAGDSSGTASGTITGSAWKTEDLCVSGKCLYFDGASHISLGDDNNFDFTSSANWTVIAWIRHAPKTTGTEVIVAKSNASAGYKLYMEADGDITFAIDDDATWNPDASVSSTAATYDDSLWHSLAAVKTGTSKLDLYIDGVLVGTNDAISGIGDLTNSANLYIGTDGDGISNGFVGFIDEVKIYTTTAKTATTIKSDTIKGSTDSGSSAVFIPDMTYLSEGLIGYWKLNGNAGDNSLGRGGLHNRDATYVAGKFGEGSEHVPASSQYLWGNSTALNGIKTFSFWVNPDSTTNYFMTYNNASIESSSGTITTTGLSNPKIYINGQPSGSLTADTWQLVTVTTDSSITSQSGGNITLPSGSIISSTNDIYCLTPDDCKMVYYDSTNSAIRFMDCDDATCTSGTATILDGAIGCVLTGGDGCNTSRTVGSASFAIYCPTADDCKIVYQNTTNTALMFADCANTTCTSGSVEILDGYTSCGLTGGDACNTAGDSGDSGVSIACPTATDCKISYYEAGTTSLLMGDCDDAACSTGSTNYIDGDDACGLSGGIGCYSDAVGTASSIACPTATDCKISYYDGSNTALLLADCDDATCTSGSIQSLDGYNDDSGNFTDIFCVTASDCKMAFRYENDTSLRFMDCDDATCTSGTVTTVDGAWDCGLSGGDGCSTTTNAGDYVSLYCPAANDCKMVYTGGVGSDLMFADCDDTTCSTGSVELLDGDTGCALNDTAPGDGCRSGLNIWYEKSLFCPTASTCKIAYSNGGSSLLFGSCADATCSDGRVEILDGETNCGLTNCSTSTAPGNEINLYCPAADNCKIAYYDSTNTALMFADCSDEYCSLGIVQVLDGYTGCVLTNIAGDVCNDQANTGQYDLTIACPAADDCKISYYDGTDTALMFGDCADETCSTGRTDVVDGASGCSVTGCNTGRTAGTFNDLVCLTASDCKVAYNDSGGSSLLMADCGDGNCATGQVRILDGAASCLLTSGDVCDTSIDTRNFSMYCPTADDCKIAYQDFTNTALVIADCNTDDGNGSCPSGSVEYADGLGGCTLTGGDACDVTETTGSPNSLFCPEADDCKISYFSNSSNSLYFADCADATCSTGSVELLDGDAGCSLTGCDSDNNQGNNNSLYCPEADDCKISYSDTANTALEFADCADATCSSGTIKTIDGTNACALTGGDGCDESVAADTVSSIYCPTTGDCKVSFIDTTRQAIKMADCDDTTCYTGSVNYVDGVLANKLVAGDSAISCPTAGDCKMVYKQDSDSSLIFVDCDDATCTTGTTSVLDGATGCVLTGGDACDAAIDAGDNVAIFCPAADNCKISYYDTTNSALMFADCANATCTSGSVQILDGASDGVNCALTSGDGCSTGSESGMYSALYCPAADNCKISYYDDSTINTRLLMADCADESCSTGSVEILDGYTGCSLSGGDVCSISSNAGLYTDIFCPTAGDCKISYYDATNTSVRMADCGNETCSTGSVEVIDGASGCGLSSGDACNTGRSAGSIGTSIYCPATGDCKIAYYNGTDSALMMADCADETCSTGSVEILDGTTNCGLTGGDICDTSQTTGYYPSIYCPATGDCKISYHDNGNTSLMMADCADESCSTGSVEILDGLASCSLTNGDACNTAISAGIVTTSLTCPATDDCKISYIDATNYRGLMADCADATCSTGSVETTAGGMSTTLQVGKVGTNYFDGTLDEIRVYNRILTPLEIENLYNWASGPVAYWKLDEGSGSTANDASGNSNTGTITAGRGNYIAGKFGSGYNFDGVDSIINAGSNVALDNLASKGGLTIEAWINPGSQGEGNAGIIAAKNSGTTPSAGWLLQFAGTNALTFTVDGATDLVRTTSNSIISSNAWNYVTVVWDGVITTANSVHIYINGVEATYATTTNGATIVDDSSSSFYIGNDSTQARTFAGTIDDVKVYSYPRNTSQFTQDMNAGHPAPGSPVGSAIGHWSFDEGSLNTCSGGANDYCDSSINANDLLFSTTTGGFTNSAKFGKAFNGTGGVWAYRADDSDFDFSETESLSISMWFKSDTAAVPSASEFLLDKSQSDGSQSAGYAIYSTTQGYICFAIDDDTSWEPDVSACNSTNLYDAAWHHILGVRDIASDRLYLYVDGQEKKSTTDSTTASLANARILYIGDRQGTDDGDEFNGDIDELKIYRSSITPDQVKTEYNAGYAQVFGATSTDSSGNATWSSTNEYCLPGQGTACTAPVGEWKFDENTGQYSFDTSTNSYTGTLGSSSGSDTNDPTWTIGKFGSGLSFDGSNDYVDFSTMTITPTAGTIGMWLYRTFTNTVATDQTTIILYTSTSNRIRLNYSADSDAWGVLLNSGGVTKSITDISADTIPQNTWTYVNIVWDTGAGDILKFYANGTVQGTPQTGIGDWSGALTSNRVGETNTGTNPYTGLVDNIRIYNYVRSQAQIAWEYNQGAPIAYYAFDECSGATAYNSALDANGNAAGMNGSIYPGTGTPPQNTAVGTCGSGNNYEMWNDGTTGKRNASLGFDGSDDYISISDPGTGSALDFYTGQSISLSAWLKLTNLPTNNNYMTILTKGSTDDNDDANYLFQVGNNSGNYVLALCYAQSGTGSWNCSESNLNNLTAGNWNHLLATYTFGTSSSVKKYQNGVLLPQGTWAAGNGNDNPSVTNKALWTGADDVAAGGAVPMEVVNGQIDEVQIYNYALTATQIKTLYNDGAVRFGP